jgi:hypothetical protein
MKIPSSAFEPEAAATGAKAGVPVKRVAVNVVRQPVAAHPENARGNQQQKQNCGEAG